MNSSEQQQTMLKPKLKYNFMHESTDHYVLPAKIYATLDLSDSITDLFYTNWMLRTRQGRDVTDHKSCYVLIGIRRA